MRKQRLEVEEFKGSKNALRYWTSFKNPPRVTLNIVIIAVSLVLPLKAKNRLLRLSGMELGQGVSIGFGAIFDIFYPEKIRIGDHTTIGYGTTVLAHEATQDEFRTGEVEIGENVLIGANTTILPGVKIGDNATVSACSLVNQDVEDGEFVGGVPIEKIDRDK